MKKLLPLLLLFAIGKIVNAQVYKINDYNGKTVNVCKGQFTSSNGLNTALNYNNNENYTVTFCSGDPTRKIRANFFYIGIEQGYDFLYVYDGTTATGTPKAVFTGYTKFPGVITSTGTCLTFKFVSDSIVPSYGWDVFLGCTPVSCGVNQPASDECISATPICNLGGYCGSTSGWYTRGPEATGIDGTATSATPFCGETHNNSWLSFVASTTSASFDITSSNCSDSSLGIQAVIFETNDCQTFLRKSTSCFENQKGNFTLSANGLTVGKKYYIMVDGAYGNDCEYTILAKSGVQTINITASNSNTLCTGQPLVVTANATGVGPFTYKWTPKPISANADSSTVTYPVSTGKTYTCSVSGVCGTPTSVTYTPSVNITPVITATDSARICSAGNGTQLTAGISNSSPSIYFANNVTSSIPDNDVTGITSILAVGSISGNVGTELQQVCFSIDHGNVSELDIALKAPDGSIIDLSSGNGGSGSNYTKTCFSTSAASPITSGTAPFTGTYLPEQPFSGLSASTINGNWGLIVKDKKVNSVGLLTSWSLSFKNDFTYTWLPVTGLSTATGSIVTANPAVTTTYTATVTDKAGCSASKTVKVNVTDTPAAPAVTSPVIYCVGAAATPLAATGTGLLWYTVATGGLGSSTVPVPSTATAGSTDYYVSQQNGTCEGGRAKITVVVNSKINASFSYPSSGFCQNTANPFPVIAPGAVAGIFKSTPAGLVFVNNTTGEIDLKASVPGTYLITNEIAPVGGCATVISAPFTLTIYPEPSLSNSSTAQVCSGTALNIVLTSPVPSNYSWSATDNLNTTGETLTPKQTGVINDVLMNQTAGPEIVKYTIILTSQAGACINLKPQTIDVTVFPEPSITNSSTAQVCSGTALNISLTSTVASTYSWIAMNNPNTNGETYTAPKQTDVINDVLINTSSVAEIVKYTVMVTSNITGCSSIKPQTIDVTVFPEPAITNSTTAQVCSGTALNISLTSTVASTYSWMATNNPNTNGETYTAPKQTDVINDVLINTTSAAEIVKYTVTLTSKTGGCLNLKPQTIDVTVYPEPVLSNASTAEICSGDALNIILTSNVASGFSWVAADNKNTTGETYISPKQTGVINDVLVNHATGPEVVTYTIILTSKTGGCLNLKPHTIDVTVNKTVAAFTANPTTGEMPLLVQFTNASTGANNYSWDFGDGYTSSDLNPTHTYNELGHFEACLITDDKGECFDKTCVGIDVYINSAFTIPNVFTPNNDGMNDVFTITGKGIESVHAEIYNRWGQKEYEWNAINGGWDGHSASGVASTSGIYFFIMEIKGVDGKKYSENGSVTLIR